MCVCVCVQRSSQELSCDKRVVDFAVPVEQLSKNLKWRKERQVLRPCQRTKQAVEHEGDANSNCKWGSLKRSTKA